MDSIKHTVKNFFEKGKQQSFKKGEILIRADDNPSGIFYLKEGIVKEYTISKKGEEIIVNVFKPESFFPMSWAINETTNTYYYEALTEVKVAKITKDEVISFLKKNPDVLFDLLSRIYKGLEGLMTRMVYVMSESAYDRLIVELLIHAKRFGIQNGKSYEVELSERDLAARSGATRETISREMKKLKDKNLVALNKNRLTIFNISLLEKELNGT